MLFIRGVTLPGAGEGIKYYLIPDFKVMMHAKVSYQLHSLYLCHKNIILIQTLLPPCQLAKYIIFKSLKLSVKSFIIICIRTGHLLFHFAKSKCFYNNKHTCVCSRISYHDRCGRMLQCRFYIHSGRPLVDY